MPQNIQNMLGNIKTALQQYVAFMDAGNISKIDSKQLAIGTEHEKEHTDNVKIARKIAADHLRERGDYYQILQEAGL